MLPPHLQPLQNVAVFFVKQRVPLWVGAARTVRLVLPTYLRLCGTYPAHEVDSLDNLGGAKHRYLITYFGSQVPSDCGWTPTQGVGVGGNPEPATELLRRSILAMAGAVHGQGGTHLVDLPTLTMHGGVGVSAWVSAAQPSPLAFWPVLPLVTGGRDVFVDIWDLRCR